jgi:transposase
VLTVEDWAEIRRLHFGEGLGKQTIAKRLGIARNTVKDAIKSNDPPAYRRRRMGSAVDPFEPQIRELLKECNTMPATVIAERIGWTRGITILKERVAELRSLYLDPDPYQRTDYRPGELAQWDLWFPPIDIPVGYGHSGCLPVIVGVSGFSRVIGAHDPVASDSRRAVGSSLVPSSSRRGAEKRRLRQRRCDRKKPRQALGGYYRCYSAWRDP